MSKPEYVEWLGVMAERADNGVVWMAPESIKKGYARAALAALAEKDAEIKDLEKNNSVLRALCGCGGNEDEEVAALRAAVEEKDEEIERLEAEQAIASELLGKGGDNTLEGRVESTLSDLHALRASVERKDEQIKTIEGERDKWRWHFKTTVNDLQDDMECLPKCDSYGHEDDCPVTNPMAAFRILRAEVEKLKIAAIAAVDAELELPGDMPDRMLILLRDGDLDAMQEVMRSIVRLTKSGIRDRLHAALTGESKEKCKNPECIGGRVECECEGVTGCLLCGYTKSRPCPVCTPSKEKCKTCEWSPEDDSGGWQTDCGNLFVFFDGGPVENSMKFCTFCGDLISVPDCKDGE